MFYMDRRKQNVAKLVELLCINFIYLGLVVVGTVGPTTTNSTAITKLRR
jgi:hypothetical protein